MPRGKLNEQSVQKSAINWLATYYGNLPEIKTVVSKQEAWLKKHRRLRRGRADGLIAMLSHNGKVIVASIEAKSSRTYRAITPDYLDKKWVTHTALVSLVIAFLAAIVGWEIGGWFLKWVLPAILFVLIAFAFLGLTYDSKRYRPISVVGQVKRYPANYQWIALSADIHNKLLPDEQYNALLKDCTQEGVGLLKVSSGNKITIIKEPVFQNIPKKYKDFLECYAGELDLRKRLVEADAQLSMLQTDNETVEIISPIETISSSEIQTFPVGEMQFTDE